MYWYKVKNVLIILFALINVFLLGAIAVGNAEKKREEERLSESLVKVLENSKVQIDRELIPQTAPRLSTKQVENRVEPDAEFASLVLGGNAEIRYDDSGNLYYAFGGGKLYLANGRLHYYNTSFSGDGDVSESAVAAAKEMLRKIGAPMADYRNEIQGDTVVFTMYIDGVPLFGNTLNVKMAGNKVGELWGYIIINTAYSGTQTRLRSAADVLLEFLQDSSRGTENVTVTAIELGYSVLAQGTDVDFKTADAIPTYRVQTDDGREFYYDARQN